MVDQITDGQLQWQPLESDFDHISIGYGDKNKIFTVPEGENKFKESLLKRFPKETEGIKKYFDLVEETKSFEKLNGLLKVLPLGLSWIIAKSGILKLISNFWSGMFKKSTMEIVESLTSDKDLQTVMTYCWGDYGSPPSESHFAMQVIIINLDKKFKRH